MSIEAMKQALDALELFCEYGTIDKPIERRDALRTAIEQAEKREWVELTKEEIFELCTKHKDEPFSLLLAVQDKLKEKNT